MAYHLKHKPEKWIPSTRILCIDHGSRTLGLAVSNEAQTIVTPLETIRKSKWSADKNKLDHLIKEFEIGVIVIGYPLNMDGSKGARCQSVKDYVTLMEQEWPSLEYFFWDERLSTQIVDKYLDKDMTQTREKRKHYKDALAAQVILDEALQWLRNTA